MIAVRRTRRTRSWIPVLRPGPGTPVTVVGLSRSGIAAAQFLLELGALVRVTEKVRTLQMEKAAENLAASGALVELGRHTPHFIEGSHLIVVSPGVPMAAPPIRWAIQREIPVVSELELGSWYCPGRMVAVTGSNGKSTVVTLLNEILRTAGKESIVCGNIGIPICGVLGRMTPHTIVVLEVSSFQLETSLSFHTQIACLINVTTNHLDRHGSFAKYRQAKAKLFAYQDASSWAVFNADDPVCRNLTLNLSSRKAAFSRTRKVEGAFLQDGWLRCELPMVSGAICRREELWAQGIHHEENALAAACLGGLLEVPMEALRSALSSFQGLPHRQQVVTSYRGVTFVNDSKSTTVTAGLKAIQAAPGRVVLIAGGRDKGSDFRPLRDFKEKLKAAILIGEDAPKIEQALKGVVPVARAQDLEEAIRIASREAQAGEWVLLSPMCTSFDMFQDFEERGSRFTEAVYRLTNGLEERVRAFSEVVG